MLEAALFEAGALPADAVMIGDTAFDMADGRATPACARSASTGAITTRRTARARAPKSVAASAGAT